MPVIKVNEKSLVYCSLELQIFISFLQLNRFGITRLAITEIVTGEGKYQHSVFIAIQCVPNKWKYRAL